MKRIISAILALFALCAALAAPSFAEDEKPAGWWPAWSAYNNAVDSGKEADILSTGDEVIRVYQTVPLNGFTANGLYMVYYTRMKLEIYENAANYAAALDNTRKLLEMSTFLTANGVDRSDMILTCRAHIKALTPSYGVYALSATATSSFGAYAPASGTYYGATSGSENFAERGITSFYVELDRESARARSSSIASFDNGKRAILINLNFKDEGDTARAIPTGKYDANINDSLAYIASLTCPVLVRIGAEMNVWTNAVEPADFIKAYEYVAAAARKLAPNAALVWSPNYVSSWGADVRDFYPADKYVDWVGVSLYYKYSTPEKITAWVEWAHQGRFADPVICAEEVIAVADAHKKPVIVTEGGAAHNTGDADAEKWAVSKIAKEFSTLNMVFPQVKAIVYFDKKINGNDYTLSGDVLKKVNSAISANPALRSSTDGAAGTWTGLGSFSENPGDTLLIGAAGHTYKSAEMKAVYTLDGEKAASTGGAPNYYKLDAKSLAKGRHTLEVALSDGAGYSVRMKYRVERAANGTVSVYGPGDVNSDGKVNARDVTAIMKALTGAKPSKYDGYVADVNADGKINARDVTALMGSLV